MLPDMVPVIGTVNLPSSTILVPLREYPLYVSTTLVNLPVLLLIICHSPLKSASARAGRQTTPP